MERLGWSIEEAADRLGIGRSVMCELIRKGAVGSVKIGRRRIVPEDSLSRYLSGLIESQAGRGMDYETTYTEHGHNTHRVPRRTPAEAG
jgi:excisionase family DNA binding protein